MVSGKQHLVLIALMPHSKVDGGAICCGSLHHLCHDCRHAQLLLSRCILDRLLFCCALYEFLLFVLNITFIIVLG